MKNILSIDGGGIRGIIPGVILAYIESEIVKKTGDKQARLSDYFDMIAGTSTGGILTCCYLAPGKKYSAQDAVDLYLTNGGQIFSIPGYWKIKSMCGLNNAKYPVEYFESLLERYFKGFKLSQIQNDCCITSYDITRRKIKIFNSIDAKKTAVNDFALKDICRATSAAPTFFKPARIKSEFGEMYNLIDGGMFANNPTMCAYAEAKEHYQDEDLFILSIGTGTENKSYSYEASCDWGIFGWLQPIIDILMNANSECTNYVATKLENKNDYIRFNPSLCSASHDMDNASEKNLFSLVDAGKTFVSENLDKINEVVDFLIK